MKDTLSESREITITISIAFKNLNFVVATFGEAIGIRTIKRIQYAGEPVKHVLEQLTNDLIFDELAISIH